MCIRDRQNTTYPVALVLKGLQNTTYPVALVLQGSQNTTYPVALVLKGPQNTTYPVALVLKDVQNTTHPVALVQKGNKKRLIVSPWLQMPHEIHSVNRSLSAFRSSRGPPPTSRPKRAKTSHFPLVILFIFGHQIFFRKLEYSCGDR